MSDLEREVLLAIHRIAHGTRDVVRLADVYQIFGSRRRKVAAAAVKSLAASGFLATEGGLRNINRGSLTAAGIAAANEVPA